jgi:uncharacterized membrane protein YedE/YeeE
MMTDIINAIIGGAMIGLAASMLLLFYGRVAGISGIVGGLLQRPGKDTQWQALFVAGLLTGGGVLMLVTPTTIAEPSTRTLGAVAIAGLLVGVGVRMGRGCTSGHGVCGLSRLSKRSLVATLSFMATGFATATIIQLFFGGTV